MDKNDRAKTKDEKIEKIEKAKTENQKDAKKDVKEKEKKEEDVSNFGKSVEYPELNMDFINELEAQQ